MKVYSTFSNLPQLKIKNKKLMESGFKIGSEYTINYRNRILVLKLKENQSEFHYNREEVLSKCNKQIQKETTK